MKLHIFGSCAGTEPMPSRHHTAFALETGGGLYWFDAGENCSYTAHLMGLDLLTVRAVFISHTHMDHVGGLGNLFWNIRKLTWVNSRQPERDIELYIPNMITWDAIHSMLLNTEDNFRTGFAINSHQVTEGVIFDDGVVRVEALHNRHLGNNPPWRSFSYRISAEGKSIVYSGDIRDVSDIDKFLADGCEVLLIETGHHMPNTAPEHIKANGYNVGMLAYIHNGAVIRDDPQKADRLVREIWDGDFVFCSDGQTIVI